MKYAQVIEEIQNIKFEYNMTVLEENQLQQLLNAVGNPEKLIQLIKIENEGNRQSLFAFLSSIFKENKYRTGVILNTGMDDWTQSILLNGKAPGQSLFGEMYEATMEKAKNIWSQEQIKKLGTEIRIVTGLLLCCKKNCQFCFCDVPGVLQQETYSKQKPKITLKGQWQLENAVAARAIVETQRQAGFCFTEESIRKGLLVAEDETSFYRIGKNPDFIFQYIEKKDAAKSFATSVEALYENKIRIFIIGLLRNQMENDILQSLCQVATHVITVSTRQTAGITAYELAEQISGEISDKISVTTADSLEEAVEMASLLADSTANYSGQAAAIFLTGAFPIKDVKAVFAQSQKQVRRSKQPKAEIGLR